MMKLVNWICYPARMAGLIMGPKFTMLAQSYKRQILEKTLVLRPEFYFYCRGNMLARKVKLSKYIHSFWLTCTVHSITKIFDLILMLIRPKNNFGCYYFHA